MRTRKTLLALLNGFRASRPPAPAPAPASRLPSRLYYCKAYPLNPWHEGGWWEDEQGTKVSPYFPNLAHAAAWRLTRLSHEAGA